LPLQDSNLVYLIQRGQSNELNPSNLHHQRELVSSAAGTWL